MPDIDPAKADLFPYCGPYKQLKRRCTMYTIQKYVLEKMKEKRISKAEFAKRAGYINISKGCRRFDDFIQGVKYNGIIIDNLHLALEVPEEEVDEILRKTKLEIEREIEENTARQIDFERRGFVPYLYCQTANKRPVQIWLCALMKADHSKEKKLPLYFNSLKNNKQIAAVKELIAEVLNRHNGVIPGWGKIICFTLKRYYDDIESQRRVYDLNGNIIHNPPDEYRRIFSERSSLNVKGKDLLPILSKLLNQQ